MKRVVSPTMHFNRKVKEFHKKLDELINNKKYGKEGFAKDDPLRHEFSRRERWKLHDHEVESLRELEKVFLRSLVDITNGSA